MTLPIVLRPTRVLRTALALLAALIAAPLRPLSGQAAPPGVSDLPLTEVPVTGVPVSGVPVTGVPATRGVAAPLVVMLSGDGGWARIDRQIASTLARHGVPVVGLDARTYLSTPRTVDGTAADVARVARHYMRAWDRDRVAIVGYSRGADIAPFIASRLPPDLRQSLALVAMLGPAERASFEFHWVDLVRDMRRPTDLPVAPELARLRGTRMLCVYGTGEHDSACASADPSLGIARYARVGDHHFDGDYQSIAHLLLSALASDRETSGAE